MRSPFLPWRLLALLLLLPRLLAAQSADQASAQAARKLLDHRLTPLLTDARLTSGFLLDYGLAFADLTRYTWATLPPLTAPSTVLRTLPVGGGGLPDSVVSDIQQFRRAYATFATASVNDAAAWLTPLRTLNRRLETLAEGVYQQEVRVQPVPLALLLAQGQRLRPDALEKGLVAVQLPDSLLVPAPAPAEPYQDVTFFTAAPAAEEVYATPDGTVDFIYDPDSLFSRAPGLPLSRLTIDFGDKSGPQPVSVGEFAQFSISYETGGPKIIRFAASLADGTTYHAAAVITVQLPNAVARPSNAVGYGQGGNFRNYRFPRNDSNFAFAEAYGLPDNTFGDVQPSVMACIGNYSSCPPAYQTVKTLDGARVTVAYGGQRNVSNPNDNDQVHLDLYGKRTLPLFKKPLIVIEGFDSWKFDGSNNYNFDSLLYEVLGNRGLFNVPYSVNGANINFASQLADAGQYDLVFIDFENGSADIRHNAMIVVNVIEWVIAHYDPAVKADILAHPTDAQGHPNPNRIVVMGQSMGGLIGRYALGYLDHGSTLVPGAPAHPGVTAFVRHLITRDSPHRGAVTPLSLQVATRRLANINLWWPALVSTQTHLAALPAAFLDLQDVVPALLKARRLLGEPASLQLNLEQEIYTPDLGSAFAYPQHAGNDFRDTQYRAMVTYASPAARTYEVTMLSNGSECGTPQPLASYDELVRVNAEYAGDPVMLTTTGLVGGTISIAANAIRIKQRGEKGWMVAPLIAGITSGLFLFVGKDFKTHASLRANPEPTTAAPEIVNVSASYRMRLFRWSLLRFLPLYFNIRLFSITHDARANTPAYERAPGGYYLNTIAYKLPRAANYHWQIGPLLTNSTQVYMREWFNFVPTASAIDLPDGQGTPLTQAQFFNGYSDNSAVYSHSTAERFLTQTPEGGLPSNTRHIQFTTRSARFVYALLEPGANALVPSCSALRCDPDGFAIEGPSNVCTAGTQFSFLNVPGAVYNWTVSGALLIVDPDHAGQLVSSLSNVPYHQITVVPNGPNSINGGSISLTFSSECWSSGPTALTKYVSAQDVPDFPGTWSVTSDGQCYPSWIIRMPYVAGATNYQANLNVTGGTGQIIVNLLPHTGGNVPPAWYVRPTVRGQHFTISATLTVTTNCSAVTRFRDDYETIVERPNVNCRPLGTTSPIGIYPVPADEFMHVELLDVDSLDSWSTDTTLTTSFQLIDNYGQTRLTQSAPGREADLPVATIPTGFYVLRVQRGTRLESTQISIQH